MDVFELLKTDHKKVAQLFEEIESASGQAKRQLFSRLKSELDVHAHVEETIFYPALEDKELAREITLEAYEEHKVVKDLLAELAGGESPDDEWDAKLTVLKENVEHHVEEEEGEMFSKARNVLSQEQIEQFGAEMEAEKARQGRATPRETGQAPPNRQPAQGKRQSTKGKTKSPGVLRRLASLVGLAESSSGGSQKRDTGAKRSAATKRSSKGKSGKQTTKSSTKKSGSKTTGRKRGSSKKGAASTKRGTTKSSGSASRRSAGKAVAGARARSKSSKKGKGRTSTKRSRGK